MTWHRFSRWDDLSSQQYRVQRCVAETRRFIIARDFIRARSRWTRLCLSDKSLRRRKRRRVSALQIKNRADFSTRLEGKRFV